MQCGEEITIIVFSILIVVSIILVNSLFVEEYTEDDIFGTSFSTFFQILFNIFILLPEIDWFYNIMYFLFGKKKTHKTVLNAIAGICSVGIIVSFCFFDLFLKQAEIFILLFLALYILIRIIYAFVSFNKL